MKRSCNTRGNLEAADGDGIRSGRSRGPAVPADNFPPNAPPRRSARDSISRSDQLTAKVFQHRRHFSAELAVAVEYQILGCTIFGKASRSCCTIQAPVGCSVTLKCRMLRRPWLITKKHYSIRKVAVGTVKKSMAAMASRWFLRKVSQRW